MQSRQSYLAAMGGTEPADEGYDEAMEYSRARMRASERLSTQSHPGRCDSDLPLDSVRVPSFLVISK